MPMNADKCEGERGPLLDGLSSVTFRKQKAVESEAIVATNCAYTKQEQQLLAQSHLHVAFFRALGSYNRMPACRLIKPQ
jgi:hypothetical protein